MSYLFDAHSHVQFPAYDGDREAVIERAQKAGVKMLAVGTQYATSQSAITLAQKYPKDVWATVGFHPNHLSTTWHHDLKEQQESIPEVFDKEKFLTLAHDPKCVAIGEFGLDYYRITGDEKNIKEKQQEVFREHVQIAQAVEKPLMIHCRPKKGTDDAYEDLLGLLGNARVPAVIHFYVGSPAITEQLLTTGCYFTFGGVITFARDYDESIRLIPLERILLETDCPYVAPLSQRGKRNEPAFIPETYRKMAEIKKVDYDRLVQSVQSNFESVFRVNAEA